MRNAAWASVAAALVAVLAAQADGPATAPAKTIALDSICATSGQKELKTVDTGPYLEAANAPAVVAFAWGMEFKALTKEGLIPATGTREKPQTLTPPADAGGCCGRWSTLAPPDRHLRSLSSSRRPGPGKSKSAWLTIMRRRGR